MRFPGLMAAFVLLVGCATTTSERARGSDLDLVPRQIPAILTDALRYPYLAPVPANCATITVSVEALDAVLGEDLDTVPRPSRNDQTGKRLLISGVQSVIPYFGWLRRLSGADRRQRLAQAAFTAGAARRGYLKGLGQRLGCLPPAAPKLPSGND